MTVTGAEMTPRRGTIGGVKLLIGVGVVANGLIVALLLVGLSPEPRRPSRPALAAEVQAFSARPWPADLDPEPLPPDLPEQVQGATTPWSPAPVVYEARSGGEPPPPRAHRIDDPDAEAPMARPDPFREPKRALTEAEIAADRW